VIENWGASKVSWQRWGRCPAMSASLASMLVSWAITGALR
tara:strand:- start:99 stop:218 length:120 start_codon:yes stop_codon:yes gene_type:complete